MINIHLYLNDKEETPIESFHDIPFDPFHVGMEFNISVDEIVGSLLSKYNEHTRKKLVEKHTEFEEKFQRKTVKVVKRGVFLSTDSHLGGKIIIEYHCALLD
jgi:hypothetical protein